MQVVELMYPKLSPSKMARYLAVSGRTISAHDMRYLGLLTHIVEEEPHVSITHSLAHTIPVE